MSFKGRRSIRFAKVIITPFCDAIDRQIAGIADPTMTIVGHDVPFIRLRREAGDFDNGEIVSVAIDARAIVSALLDHRELFRFALSHPSNENGPAPPMHSASSPAIYNKSVS